MKNAARLAAQLRVAWTRKLVCGGSTTTLNICTRRLRVPLIEVVDVTLYLAVGTGERRQLLAVAHIENDPWLRRARHAASRDGPSVCRRGLAISGESPHGPAAKPVKRCAAVPVRKGPTSSCPAAEDRLLQRLRKVYRWHRAQMKMKQRWQLQGAPHIAALQCRCGVSRCGAPFGRRSLGPAKGRRASYELWLSLILQDFFFVETIWAETYIPARDQSATVLRSTARMQI